MPYIAYIDPDEEIISVIGRLRTTQDPEVFFAVPKRALFLQSLVNLRLLDREAKKIGKRLCLVTPDESGRALAEKVGIETRNSLEGVEGVDVRSVNPALPARLSRVDHLISPDRQGATLPSPLHSESIGSTSFFSEKETSIDTSDDRRSAPVTERAKSSTDISPRQPQPSSLTTPLRSLPVRERTPQRLTSLNSTREVDAPSASVSNDGVPKPTPARRAEGAMESISRVSFNFSAPETPFSPIYRPPVTPASSESAVSGVPLKPETVPSVNPETPPETPISRFYQNRNSTPSSQTSQKGVSAEMPAEKKVSSGTNGRPVFRRVIFGFLTLSALAVIGVALFVFVPRADVTVLVGSLSEDENVEVSARIDQESVDVDKMMIPLRLIEVEKDITESFPGTGQASVSDKRARGMVVLSNEYGSDAQPLVATTRLETSDGKIFRLVKGVTIPGTKKDESGATVPGTIDAEVVADKAGDEYNIDPTTFTIPGLKGGPKFEKISASSEKTFVGGGSGDSEIASVSADDVLRAKEFFEEKLPELLRTELEKDLGPDEKILDGAILSETLSSGAFPGVGAVAPSFDYRARVSVRALVFSDADMREVSASALGEGAEPSEINVEYTVPRPDFTTKSLLVKARVSLSKSQSIDVEGVKKSILGKNVADIQGIFVNFPNIQKIEVVFWPKFMTSRIPSRAEQVQVHVETAPES